MFIYQGNSDTIGLVFVDFIYLLCAVKKNYLLCIINRIDNNYPYIINFCEVTSILIFRESYININF